MFVKVESPTFTHYGYNVRKVDTGQKEALYYYFTTDGEGGFTNYHYHNKSYIQIFEIFYQNHNISLLKISWDISAGSQYLVVEDFLSYSISWDISHGSQYLMVANFMGCSIAPKLCALLDICKHVGGILVKSAHKQGIAVRIHELSLRQYQVLGFILLKEYSWQKTQRGYLHHVLSAYVCIS